MVPTVGVYPIATANDKSQISAPLMSRFAVIDIPDYTSEEKKIIFSKYVLPESSETYEPQSRRMRSDRRRSGGYC